MKRILFTALLVALLVPALASGQDAKISSRLENMLADDQFAARAADGRWGVWVYFTDKGVFGADLAAAVRQAEQEMPARTLQRRAKTRSAGRLVDGTDLPVAPSYIEAVSGTGARLRKQSRWLNAASFNATPAEVSAIAALPFVKRVDLVARFIRPQLPVTSDDSERAEQMRAEAKAADRWSLGYGGSTAALEQINVPPVHELGLTGDGVLVAMLDAGFRTVHAAFDNLDIVDQWDFVNNDGVVDEEAGDATYQARHGTQTLSVIAGFKEGELVGPAYGASVVLGMTEEVGDELPIEEDNWVAGMEWAESLGADIISTSLGYYYWYEFSDMDGNTAVTTVAGDRAVELGMLVVTSMGNERQNEEWPHMTAPADGDSVIGVGAVDSGGEIASFSSPGPTFDGRIKPDVSARGVSSFLASYYDDVSYNYGDGTSFACPLVAGVGALMLERVPQLTPMQVREALRQTADRAGAPDNDYGWGVIDALAAVEYWGPSTQHTPLTDTEDVIGPYTVTAVVTDREPLDPAQMNLIWRLDGGAWNTVALTAQGGDTYGADIPGQAGGGLVEYYLQTGDTMGISLNAPLSAPAATYSFTVGPDLNLPVIVHPGAVDQTLATWPPVLNATASDNIGVDRVELTYTVNDGGAQGPFVLDSLGDDSYSLTFPLTVGEISEGDVILYTITAWDLAGVPNAGISGPHELRVVANLGSVLVIDDSLIGKTDNAAKSSASDIGQWLTDAGYLVDHVTASAITPGYFDGYDALVLSCGGNPAPLNNAAMREDIIAWNRDHGRILIEGGHVTARASEGFGSDVYPVFKEEVLHAAQYWGDEYITWTIFQKDGFAQHPFLNRPFVLPEQLTVEGFQYSLTAVDYVYVTEDAVPIMQTGVNSNVGGIIVHDDNTGPEAGQSVYFTFDMGFLDPALGRLITENAMAYLMAREAPGTAAISGRVTDYGGNPLAGVVVSSSTGDSFVTGADGNYTLSGLHGSYYNLTASLGGYGPAHRRVELAEGAVLDDVNFALLQVVMVQGTAAPELAIPDNDPTGVTSVITIAEDGLLFDVNIDINIEHASQGHLTVVLTNPQGTEVTLHNRTGSIADDIIGNWEGNLSVDGPGSLSDFAGQNVQGDWTLTVADHQFSALGTFHSWGLNLQVAPDGPATAPEDNLPPATRLVGNVPNPFNPQTVIAFDTARAGQVKLEVFDVRGHLVKRLVDAEYAPGRYRVTWRGGDEAGRAVASGVYFARLTAGGATHLQKMMLLR